MGKCALGRILHLVSGPTRAVMYNIHILYLQIIFCRICFHGNPNRLPFSPQIDAHYGENWPAVAILIAPEAPREDWWGCGAIADSLLDLGYHPLFESTSYLRVPTSSSLNKGHPPPSKIPRGNTFNINTSEKRWRWSFCSQIICWSSVGTYYILGNFNRRVVPKAWEFPREFRKSWIFTLWI